MIYLLGCGDDEKIENISLFWIIANNKLNISLQDDGSLVEVNVVNVELGEVNSSDGDNLSSDVFTINEDSVLVDDVNDNSEFTLISTVVNVNNSTNLNELVENLLRFDENNSLIRDKFYGTSLICNKTVQANQRRAAHCKMMIIASS